MTADPTVSTCGTCHKVVGEFCVGECFSFFGGKVARPSHRTWPAVWELGGGEWPKGVSFMNQTSYQVVMAMLIRLWTQGEVDIVEGVNDQEPNASSLHTSPGMWSAITAPAQLVMD